MVNWTFFIFMWQYHLKFFKGCLPQILLGPFLNIVSQIKVWNRLTAFIGLQKLVMELVMMLNWIQFNQIFWLAIHTNPMIVSQKVQYDCKTEWNRLPSSKVSFIENNSNKLKNSLIHSRTLAIKATTQQNFFCSKSTIETLEKGVKYVQS